MSLKTVDLQTAIPKSAEVARAQESLERQVEGRQQMFAATFQQRAERARERVTNLPRGQEARIAKDGRRKDQPRGGKEHGDGEHGAGGGEAAGGREARSGSGAAAPPRPPGRGNRLNILV